MAGDPFYFVAIGVEDVFPNDNRSYEFTPWARWEKRIHQGSIEDQEQIRHRAAMGIGPDVQEEWIESEMYRCASVTNAMCAALITSIWAQMESTLKEIVDICKSEMRIMIATPFRFLEIKQFFLKHLMMDLSHLSAFDVADSVRILNNCFKHSDGLYTPDRAKAHTQISQTLLDKWSLLTDVNKIDYKNVPVQEVVVACSQFIRDLLANAGAILKGHGHGK